MLFKFGDKVSIWNYDDEDFPVDQGEIAVVIAYDPSDDTYKVAFDRDKTWWLDSENVKPVDYKEPVIYYKLKRDDLLFADNTTKTQNLAEIMEHAVYRSVPERTVSVIQYSENPDYTSTIAIARNGILYKAVK